MFRRTALAGLAIGAALALPITASAQQSHATPKAVAWKMKVLANQNLKFAGSKLRVRSVICAGRGYPLYVCKATFTDGEHYAWRTVTFTDSGLLKASGGYSL